MSLIPCIVFELLTKNRLRGGILLPLPGANRLSQYEVIGRQPTSLPLPGRG